MRKEFEIIDGEELPEELTYAVLNMTMPNIEPGTGENEEISFLRWRSSPTKILIYFWDLEDNLSGLRSGFNQNNPAYIVGKENGWTNIPKLERSLSVDFSLADDIPGIRKNISYFDLTDEEKDTAFNYYVQRVEEYRKRRKDKERLKADKGRVSVPLSGNISRKRDPSLFDGLEEKLMISDKDNYIDRKGRPIALTAKQIKILWGLSHWLSQSLDDEDFKGYAKNLEADPNWRGTPIERTLNLQEFDKAYTSPDGKTRPRQVEALREDLRSFNDSRQLLLLKKDKKIYRLVAPLITIEEELEDLTPDQGKNIDLMNIRFSPIFLYKIQKEYFVVNKDLFRLWGKKGNGTELFAILLNDLASKQPHYKQTAITRAHSTRRSDYKTKEEYLTALETAKREGLTYTQNITTLLDRLTTDYSSRKQYRAKFWKDLDKVLSVFRDEMGLITESEIVLNASGEKALRVVFNENYLSEKKRKAPK